MKKNIKPRKTAYKFTSPCYWGSPLIVAHSEGEAWLKLVEQLKSKSKHYTMADFHSEEWVCEITQFCDWLKSKVL